MEDIEQIKGSVLAIIDRHTNVTKVNEELHAPGYLDNGIAENIQYSIQMTDTYLKDYVHLYAQLTGSSVKQSIENIVVSELHLLTNDSFLVCLGDEQLKHISLLIKEACIHSNIAELSKRVNANVNNFKHCLPVNLLFELNKQNILKLHEYIQLNISKQQVLKELVCAFEVCCLSNNEEHLQQVSDLLLILINCGYRVDTYDKALVKICQYILQYVIQHVLTKMSVDVSKKESVEKRKNVFEFIRINGTCPCSVLASCYSQQLVTYVCKNPSYKVSDAIMQQVKWNSFALPPLLFEAYKHMLLSFTSFDQIACALKKSFSKPEINWKSLLSLVSSVLVLYKEAAAFFEEFITQAIKKGLEENCANNLVIGLLLARHCSSEGSHVHMSYSTWFQKYFNAGSHNLISSARGFRFLIKFLTSLVPFEPLQYIKVHVLKPPHPPNPKLRQLLREYTTLVLTRIDDLKQSMHSGKIESSIGSQEVDEAVNMFAKTSKMPTNVMEISIFRKSYYLDKFLPVLLEPRPLPDVEDNKMKFVSALLKLGKIPKSMHASYQAKCKEASTKLFEGIIDLEDDFEDWPHYLERLKDTVKQLCATTDEDFETQAFKDLGLSLSRTLHQLIGDSSTSTPVIDEPTDIESDISPDDLHSRIVEQIFESINSVQLINLCAVAYLMKVLGNFCSVREAVCHRIWNHCTNEIQKNTFVVHSGITLLVVVGHTHHLWSVTHSSLGGFKRSSDCDENEKKKCSLLEAIFLTSASRTVSLTSFLNEVGLSLNIVEKFKKLQDFEFCQKHQQGFQLLCEFLLYSGAKLKHCLKETHQHDFLLAKRMRLDDSDNCALIDEKLVNSLHIACDYLRANFQYVIQEDHNMINEFMRREILLDPNQDFLSITSRRRFYKTVLLKQNIRLHTIRNILTVLLDGKLNIEVQIYQFICDHLQLILQMNNCVNPGLWMLSIFEERLKKITQVHISNLRRKLAFKDEVAAFVRLLTIIPPSFLFAHAQNADEFAWSQASKKMEDTCLPLSTLIKVYLRNYHFEQCFVNEILPHLFCGLIQCASTDILMNLPSSIPLMFASLLVQWKDIPDVQWICKSSCPEFYEAMSVWREEVEGNPQVNITLKLFNPDASVYSVCLAMIVLHRNAAVERIAGILNHLSSYSSDIFVAFALCVIAFTGQVMDNDATCEVVWFSNLLDSVLKKIHTSHFCDALRQPNSKLFAMFSDSVAKTFFPLSLLRLLSQSGSISSLAAEKTFLSVLLSHYEIYLRYNENADNEIQDLINRAIRNASVELLKAELQKRDFNDVIKGLLKTEIRRRCNY